MAALVKISEEDEDYEPEGWEIALLGGSSTMTKFAFDRDNVLSHDERIASARKCLNLLTPLTDGMGEREASFVTEMEEKVDRWGVSERQLAWLRDLVGKYAN